uniref:Uncharacterized protein n=1 Tax=Anguilla anguilla TaxID=7936 RepID=A0A0E9UYH1_ANGAN
MPYCGIYCSSQLLYAGECVCVSGVCLCACACVSEREGL